MTVALWMRDDLDTLYIKGDLVGLTTLLNTARANGNKYAILNEERGTSVMVEMQNITKAREQEDASAFIGG